MAHLQIPLCTAVIASLVSVSVVLGTRSAPISHGTDKSLNLNLKLARHDVSRPDLIRVTEDLPVASLLGMMEFTGPFKGEINCSFSSPYIRTKMLGSSTYYVIELARCVDRETSAEFTVRVDCWDQDKPVPATATSAFTVVVQDENDNAPVFTESIYLANVTEGVGVGEFVLTVKATDADADVNGQFSYSLSGFNVTDGSPFAIDAETGRITTRRAIDREASVNYTFNAVATDKGLPPNWATAVVVVFVDDVNDNAPVIVTKELRARENQAGDSPVGRIVALDPDFGLNAETVFSKVESDEQSTAPFEVKPNGNVFTIVPLDREQKSEYTMTVMVKDKGSPRLSSTATVTIIVEDDNDNPPEIVSPCLAQDDPAILGLGYLANNDTCGGVEGCITVDWYAPEEGRVLYQTKASDRDTGDNAELVYEIVTAPTGGDNQTRDLFAMNRSAGALTLNRQLLPSDGLVHLINVTVSDRGHPARRTSHCQLNITFDVDPSSLLLAAAPQQEMDIAPANSADSVVTVHRTWPYFGRVAITSLLASATRLSHTRPSTFAGFISLEFYDDFFVYFCTIKYSDYLIDVTLKSSLRIKSPEQIIQSNHQIGSQFKSSQEKIINDF
ncbi:Protocadherin-11 Y-linked [Bulinus truncatus]|nr:Protocadherin-11 Y-linked [Bulinus truncatus]